MCHARKMSNIFRLLPLRISYNTSFSHILLPLTLLNMIIVRCHLIVK